MLHAALSFAAALLVAAAVVQVMAEDLPPLPTDFGPCPRKTEDFLRYIVQRRAAEGLNRIVLDEKDPRVGKDFGDRKVQVGTVYGGAPEDANIAWVAAAAYRYKWSRFHRDTLLRKRAFFLLDNIARIRADGKWDDGGLNAYFGPHSFAWAALSWIETGDVDAPRAAVWRETVAKAADDGLVCLHYGPYRPSALTGQYANPEMYFLSGLAAAWKLTGQERYRAAAAQALRRYDEWLFPGGGMAYFVRSQPQHGYQQMVVKSVALYWDLTGDALALDFLKRFAPYFPNVQHRSGLLTDAEQPHLKHSFWNLVNPGTPVMIACAVRCKENRRVADIATVLMADNVGEKEPSFGKKNFPWYNYQAATYAASALRLMERHALPAPAAPPERRVFLDGSFRGPRSQWDDFTAAVGTRQMNDSLAGAYLADTREPLMPLGAAVDGVYFEALCGKQTGPRPWKSEFRCVEWSPAINYVSCEGFAATSCLTRLCCPYWGDMPYMAGESGASNEVSDWTSLQHWAVWRDALIGFGSLRCHANGGDAATHDVARVRWRLSPQDRKLDILEQGENTLSFQYGGLRVDIVRLDQRGGFALKPDSITDAPRASWTPLLVRPAPWLQGDFANVSTVVRPAGAQGAVQVKALTNGAAAALLEPDGRKAFVWVANLHRQWQQYLLDVPPGVAVRAFKRDVEMPPVPPGEPANAGLLGGESAVWVLESGAPLEPKTLLDGIRAGKGR